MLTTGCSNATEPAPPNGTDGYLTFNTNSTSSCSNPVNRTGIIRATSANAIIVEDTANPAAFTPNDYQEILSEFEAIVAPSNISAFGTHTDIDGNQKIIIFYTVEVNRLTSANSTSFVGGFFFSRDLFPRSAEVVTPTGKRLTKCDGSNAAEMFYMLAPDPAGTINNNPRSTEFVKRTTAGTIAHEYQHLINASRRLYITPGALFPEEVWLDEGLSHIAEELSYFQATPFEPMMNLTRPAITAAGVVDALNTYQTPNLARFISYLRTPSAHSPYGETPRSGVNDPIPKDWEDLETRGAIWSFLRWAADRQFAPQSQVWHRLVRDATTGGTANLSTLVGADVGARFREWAVATYVDDATGHGAPTTHIGECAQTISLAVNEVCSAFGSAAGSMTVPAAGEVREYAVVVHYFGALSRSAITVTGTASNTIPVAGPPSPDLLPGWQQSPLAAREPTRDFSFERALRHRERRELADLVVGNRESSLRSVMPSEPRFEIAPAAAFSQPSWNFRSVLPSSNNVFPLAVVHISAAPTTISLVDGGAAYLRFAVPSSGSSLLSITSGGGPVPSGVSTWVVRTK